MNIHWSSTNLSIDFPTPFSKKTEDNSPQLPKINLQTLNSKNALKAVATDELQALQAKVLDSQQPAEQRSASLYLLSQYGVQAVTQLSAIAENRPLHFEQQDNSHSLGSYQREFEISLRITALEALDHIALNSPQEPSASPTSMEKRLSKILSHQTEPSLRMLAQISLSGIESGRPGKLTRFIDQALAAVRAEK